jgi:hypothetical protein
MVPYFAMRSPFDQAKLWRQSRSAAEVDARIQSLKDQNAPFLAHCLESVGPQHGPPVTNAIPGYSWHQWGEACDCYWLRNGAADWSTDELGAANGYRIYADKGAGQGLTPGGYWQSLKDWPHLQKRKANSPQDAGLTILQVDAAMAARFG